MKMKKRLFVVFLLAILSVFLGVSALAAAPDIYADNIAAISDRCTRLNAIMDTYAELDDSAGKDIAIRTSTVIVEHYNRINNLRADPRISSQALQDEIELIYLKGAVSGECAWIYESHIGELDEAASVRVRDCYLQTLGAISAYTEIAELEASERRYPSDISVAVYTEKIGMLYTSDDSTEVAVIAAGAVEDIKKIAEGTLTEVTYEEVYLRAKEDISVQRIRERAVESFAEIYDKIYTEGSYVNNGSTDKNIAYFLYSVKNSSAIEEFNLNIKDAVGKVLAEVFSGSSGEYAEGLLSEINNSLDALIDEADREGQIVSAAGIFEGLSFRLAVANGKDELCDHVKSSGISNESIDALLLEYNGEGGIFDSCISEAQIASELGRGKLCVDFTVCLYTCEARAREMFEGFDFSDAERRIEELYAPNYNAIKCAQTLAKAKDLYEKACEEAYELLSTLEVEVYLVKHSYVILKSEGEIALSDKDALLAALVEFGELSDGAKDMLSEEISDLAEKYKAVCAQQIISYSDSAGREAVARSYGEQVRGVEFRDSESFIEITDRILQKAEGAFELYDVYESYLSQAEQFGVGAEYKSELTDMRELYLTKIFNIDHTEGAVEDKLAALLTSGDIELCRIYCVGRIDALGGVGDSSAVSGIIEASKDTLRFADSTDKLQEGVQRAILEVYKQRSCEALYLSLCEYNTRISELGYIKDSDKNIKCAQNTSKYELAVSELQGALTVTAAEQIGESAKEYFESVLSEARSLDQMEAIRVFGERAAAIQAERVVEVGTLGYLSAAEISGIEGRFSSALDSILSKFARCESIAALEAELAAARDSFSEIFAAATLQNLENARKSIGERIGEKFKSYAVADYTAENYKLIHDAYSRALSKLEGAQSIDEFIATMEGAYTAMASVTSIFEETRAEMLDELRRAYEAIEPIADRYPQGEFARIQGIYLGTQEEIKGATSSMGHEALRALTSERIALMRKVKVEWVSSGGLSSTSGGGGGYPAGYDVRAGGLWALVFGSDGLDFDVKLSVSLKDTEKRHSSAIKAAVKNSTVSYVGEIPMNNAEIAQILKGSEIKGVVDIKLSHGGVIYDSFSGVYRVKILLPQYLREYNSLSVAYISDDGSVKLYETEIESGFLVFETEHFSEFIIIGEKRIDLSPVIIVLSILAIAECVCLIILKFLYESEKTAVWGVGPIFPMSVILPRGGAVISGILVAIDIALGVYIAVMSLKLIRRRRERVELSELEDDSARDFGDDGEEESVKDVVLGGEYTPTAPATIAGTGVSPMPCLPALLDSVSAEEADSLISDSSIPSMLVISESNSGICRGCKKTFVNIDTISDNFSAGDTVSLKELKEKRLIPQSACYLKVLARGVLDKPLVIKAQSFSNNAVKMIALTGGTAVLEGGSEI